MTLEQIEEMRGRFEGPYIERIEALLMRQGMDAAAALEAGESVEDAVARTSLAGVLRELYADVLPAFGQAIEQEVADG